MIGAMGEAKINADISVRPARSQVFLISIIGAAIVFAVCGAVMISLERSAGWAFFMFSIILIAGAFYAWKTSQSDTDLQEAHPTHIAFPNGAAVTTDSRTLRHPEALVGLTRICDEMMCRKALPLPSGLVDDSTQPIPNSQDSAIAVVEDINKRMQEATNLLIDHLGLSDEQKEIVQNNIISEAPSMDGNPAASLNIVATN